ncbi:DEAD/DEAH box helicase [Cordyceps fumosorosea ARSEF 2679]|uniref:DEAD/DEAH box helicase n=1 Tax=Cordyceps fumosorosea (strain ARSEF 2679) TaxID=1081104 RepID=A0A167UBT5_CORFA|nr:DEAD/DEAH box helicase [Cordyceps fumosorosea ARSEF 2679]OAA61428.1 DEAD/DEAH box helicase [Cordyceps fumosorosea ARSEF 2679]
MLRNIAKCLLRPGAETRNPVVTVLAHRIAQASTTTAKPQKPQLRDYQQDCIRSVVNSLKSGQKRIGISLATGSGKTVIFTQLIDKIDTRADTGGDRTLILAHRRELVEQAAHHCRLAHPDKTIEIEMGSQHATGTADITVASVLSITSRDRLDKFDPTRYKLVLVDEAHHIVAAGYLRTLRHFGLDERRAASPALVGVSATFSRFDGLKLGAAIDEIAYHRDYVHMIADRWLTDVVFTTVASSADLAAVRSSAFGDFQTGELSRVVNTEAVNDVTVRSWLARAADRRSTLVFCVDLAHVAGLTATFRRRGVDARAVTGDTPRAIRAELLAAFKRGDFPVLVNCGVFTEGTDIPNVDCVVLARPTRSRNLLVQMIGRGMRLHPGKRNCHVLDMVSSLDTGIVTTPTLFGLDPDELVTAASVAQMRRLRQKRDEEAERAAEAQGPSPQVNPATAVTFTDYSSVLDLIADTSGERHIRAVSQYAWVQVGPERFVLSAPSGSYIRLERIPTDSPASSSSSTATTTTASPSSSSSAPPPAKPTYRAVEIRALPPGTGTRSPYAAAREILTAATFDAAVHGADSYAAQAFPHSFIHRHQSWRQGPPTRGQLDWINKLRGGGGSGARSSAAPPQPLGYKDLTKGKAADMITKLKHGARGQFARIEAEQRRRGRKVSAFQEMRQREEVRVGPVMS